MFGKIKYTALILFASNMLNAQEIDLSMSVDTTKFRLGEQVNAIINLKVHKDSLVEWPSIGDSIGRMEVLSKSKIDSIKNGRFLELTQTISLTQFDTGNFILNPIRFKVGEEIKYTKPIIFQVLGVEVDTTKQGLYDIKENLAVPYTFDEILPYLLIFIFVLILSYLIYRYFKTRKKIISTEPLVVITPFERAMSSLNELDGLNYLSQGNIKEYYDQLSDIMRRFLEEEHNISAMESTSEEIILAVKSRPFDLEIRTQIALLLRESDFVKFAKFQPETSQHKYFRTLTEDLIIATRINNQVKNENDGQ